MKNLLFLLVFSLFFTTAFSQSPQFINYQSIIRDSQGEALSNQLVSLRINIIEGSINGSTVYSEIHSITSNPFGIVNLLIGNGIVEFGSFENINWGLFNYYINLEIDIEGGNNYINMGSTQFVSVPYALYAQKSGDSYFNENNDGHLYFNEGRIGIGTDNPQKALHIRRVTKNGQGIGQAQLLVEADSESDATIYLGYYPNSEFNLWEGSFWRINSHKPNGDFSIADEIDNNPGGDGSVKRLVIKRNTGNVGIGIEEPQRKLHISEAMRLEPQDSAPDNAAAGDMYFGKDGKLHLYDGTNWNIVNMTQE